MGDFIGGAFAGFLIGLLFGLLLTFSVGLQVTNNLWKAETTERGLAMYCPINGEWAWIGECNG